MRNLINRNPFLFTGIFLLIIAFSGDQLISPLHKKWELSQKPETVQDIVRKKAQFTDKLFQQLEDSSSKDLFQNFGQFLKKSKNNGVQLFIFKKGNLIFWSDNQAFPRLQKVPSSHFTLKKLGNGWYLQKGHLHDDYRYQVLIPVKTNYVIQNDYLQNKILLGENINGYFNFSINSENGKSITAENGEFLFSLVPKQNLPNEQWPAWTYLLASLLCFFGFSREINILLFNKKRIKALGLFLGVVLLIFSNLFIWKIPGIVFNQPLFDPGIFSSELVFPSLGVLFCILLFITLFIHYFNKYFKLNFSPASKLIYVKAGAFFALMLLLTHGAVSFIKALVLNSDIYLDIKNFYDLTFISLVAVISIFLVFYNLVILGYWLFKHVNSLFEKKQNQLIPLIVILLLTYVLITQFTIIPNYMAGLFSLLLWGGFWFFQPQIPSNYGPITYLVLITTIFTSFHLIQFNKIKERQKSKFLATRVTYQRDVVAEHLFQNVSREIKNDKYIKNFFFNPLLPKSFLNKRIQELYFSRYLNKYDLKIHTFKYGGIPYKSQGGKSLNYFKQLIEKYGIKTPGKNLYFINKTGLNPTYIAIYEFQVFGGDYGTLVVELKQKVFYEESIYPELLLEESVKSENILQNYSYAVYKNNRLISQKGDYPYPVETEINNKGKVFYYFKQKQYSHLFHQVSHNTFVIVSQKASDILHNLSVFSFLFIIFFLLVFLTLGIQKWNFHKLKSLKAIWIEIKRGEFQPFKNLLFQRKIQLTILAIVLLVMATVGISTVDYLRYNYNQKLDEELSKKIKQILPKLEEDIQSGGSKFYNDKEKFYAQIKNLANRFQTDINIYDIQGNLVTSSQPRVYQKDILTNLMNARAYYEMRINHKSHLIQNEKIMKLNYLAAYAPIRNPQNQIMGFLNLPYFSKENKLKNEISSLIITLVDLYVLIFLLVLVVSLLLSNTLTRPLNLIREKLKKTQLGQSNAPIEWKSNDELGQLIMEYNHMIAELEENAKTLAQSEREGAWREMARQVAHEIKNPLTPMKLNIQRLESKFSKDDPRAEEINKVSKILIKQIDHLSKIATEFSAFAQISLGEPVIINVEEELQSIKDFFDSYENRYFKLNLQTENTQISIDKNHFNRIFTNLITNALHAVEEQEESFIEIGSNQDSQKTILLWVSDNGMGISEEKQSKIFQPNFSTKNSGTGLGLAMVKKMVESANGKIWFTSEENKGTTFYIRFHVKQLE